MSKKNSLPRIAVAQLHAIAGDLTGNTDRMLAAANEAASKNATVCVMSEMCISGYPIDDLLNDDAFLADTEAAFWKFLTDVPADLTVMVGLPMSAFTFQRIYTTLYGRKQAAVQFPLDANDRDVYNTVILARNGQPLAIRSKVLLPTRSVFDDSRWMLQGELTQKPTKVDGTKMALAVCEDVWSDDVAVAAATAGAEILLVANASPYHVGKPLQRVGMLARLAQQTGLTIVYVNMVGGQDEVVYDGGSMILSPVGETLLVAPLFKEGVWILGEEESATNVTVWAADDNQQIWEALTTALRDYVNGTGFTSVVVGLSGGIDCAVAAAIAVDALGPENVWGIGMPGPYSSQGSIDDARDLAERLGIRFDLIPIGKTVKAEESIIGSYMAGGVGEKVAHENVQARIRALHLMSVANSHNLMMLNTGNKSEAAMGYFTLGGDSSGGFALLKDVYKTRVYALAEWRNLTERIKTGEPRITENSLRKPPSAELAPNQNDLDSLPPYPVLDYIIAAYLEDQQSAVSITDGLTAGGLVDGWKRKNVEATVLKTLRGIDRAEYKRRSVATGPNITRVSFNTKSRRMPIMSRRLHHL